MNNQRTFAYVQTHAVNIKEVFPLLCPVREKEWIEGWNYKMVHSISGFIEKDCVFTTAHHSNLETVWHVTQYDKENHSIEFLRFSPNENTVRINIYLEKITNIKTKTHISYMYTFLSAHEMESQIKKMELTFLESMHYWEKAINYYLEKGKLLKRKSIKA